MECEVAPAEKVLIGRFQSALESESYMEWIANHWNRRELKLIRPFINENDEPPEKNQKK